MKLMSLVLLAIGISANAQMPGTMDKVKDFVKENPNCSKQVVESLRKESTVTCAKAMKPGAPDKKKALQEKCAELKNELTAAQAACLAK